jgi:hypothetical protein
MKIETVSYQVDWSKFHKGYSFFAPCIDHRAAKKVVLAVAGRLKMEVAIKVVIADGIKGLRVWRL